MARPWFVALLTLLLLCAPFARADNDDSCDIGVAPAATLLLPLFEVDFTSPPGTGRTTLFTITNVSSRPQIAHVTMWTDWAFAALNFNIHLRPYELQSVNLYDIFTRGIIAPGSGVSACGDGPIVLSATVLEDIRRIFTTGVAGTQIGLGCGTNRLGGTHAYAIGYLTIDVVASCTTLFPDRQYFTSEILFDNVLIGDYETVDQSPLTGNIATGNPMVHIRAVPEGGPVGSNPGTALPYTFYDRFTATTPQTMPRSVDRRQPLPSLFAARWIQGGPSGFSTDLQIWREGRTGPLSTVCPVSANSAISLTNGAEVTRFDEHENAVTLHSSCCCILCPPDNLYLPAASSTPTSSFVLPPITSSGDLAGWMYLNLSGPAAPAFSNAHRAGQAWVSVTMRAEGRYGVQFNAAQLGNGCSLPVAPGTTIGPVGGVPVCPPGAAGCSPGVAPYTGTNVVPVLPP